MFGHHEPNPWGWEASRGHRREAFLLAALLKLCHAQQGHAVFQADFSLIWEGDKKNMENCHSCNIL